MDWRDVKAEYEAGDISARAIARKAGISEAAIRKRAKAESWAKPAGNPDKIRGAAAVVVPPGPAEAPDPVVSPPALPEEALDPKAIAKQGRGLIARMFAELDATTSHLGELEDLIVAATAGDSDGRRRAALRRAVALPSRAVVVKNLAAAAKALEDAPGGKREETAEAAKRANSGRFATPPPPKLVVDNR